MRVQMGVCSIWRGECVVCMCGGREVCRVCGGVCAECVHRECVERSVECIERGVYRVCGEVCGRVWGSGGRNVGCV